jgi:hypothetical protein
MISTGVVFVDIYCDIVIYCAAVYRLFYLFVKIR